MKSKLIGGLAVGVLVLTGCGTGASDHAGGGSSSPDQSRPPASGSTDAPSADLKPYYSQKVAWTDCNGAFKCASMKVPLDYAHPGTSIKIALIKRPAARKAEGSLVINPGGPGGSGIDYALQSASAFTQTVRDHYDIVGFDPRGVGKSTAVDCLDDKDLDGYIAVDPTPDNPTEEKQYVGWARKMATGCQTRSKELAAHVSTVEAARDMDILRGVLGERQLSYFGASYGTKLGSTYAALFPTKVGRFVLDGAMAPKLKVLASNLAQAKGFEVALRSYVQDCVGKGGCYLGDSVDAGVKRVQRLLAAIDAHPLPAGNRQLTSGNALYGLITPLYSKSEWPYLTSALQGALKGNGAGLMVLSDSYAGRGPTGGYENNTMEANWAINCLDDPESYTPAEVDKEKARFEKVAPTFGDSLAWMLAGCDGENAKPEEPTPDIVAKGAKPIVVIGTTRDPATPYAWAKALASSLDSGVLVSRDGDGHTGYNAGNRCVDNAVDDYLVKGTVPKNGLNC